MIECTMGGLLSFNLLSSTWWFEILKIISYRTPPRGLWSAPMLDIATLDQLLLTASAKSTQGENSLSYIIYFDSIVFRVVKTIFVLGPSHHVRLSGCAVTQHVAYQTPLYDLRWRVSNVNLGLHLFLLQHQYRNQSRAPQHRPLWNNDSGSWRRWAQHWNATPLHSKGARRVPQLVFLNHQCLL